MVDWYLDPINGTDTNCALGGAGSSFANRCKKADNFISSVIAAGDRIKIIASPSPTSLGQTATWTNGPPGAAGTSITSSTDATPIVVTLSSGNYTALAPAVGDTVMIVGHTTNTKANGTWKLSAIDGSAKTVTLVNADGTNSVGNGVGGFSGTIRKINSLEVRLTSAVTKPIAVIGNQGVKSNWTASLFNTCTIIQTDFKEGGECQKIDIGATFTTGLAAFVALSGSTDYSGYQQITFWFKQTAGTIGAAGAIQVKLCSDTAGATPVDTFDIPNLQSLNRWVPITVDKGSALGSAIQSIAFYVVTDNGAQTFQIDDIQACKASSSADSLTLTSVIGKNTSGEGYYAIQSINDVRILLDYDTNSIPNNTALNQRGYYGTTETVTTYKRETLKVGPFASSTTNFWTIQKDGTATSLITYSGGWNRTDMSTQDTGDETWFDGLNGNGNIFYGAFSRVNIGFEKLSFVRCYQPLTGTNTGYFSINFGTVTNCLGGTNLSNAKASLVNIDYYLCNNAALIIGDGCIGTFKQVNGSNSIGLQVGNICNLTATSINGNGPSTYGLYMNGVGSTVKATEIKNNAYIGLAFGTPVDRNRVMGATFSGNVNASFTYTNGFGKNYLYRCTLSDSTKVSSPGTNYLSDYGVYSHEEGGVAGAHNYYSPVASIVAQTSVRHTASGYAMQLSPQNTTYVSQYCPLPMQIATWAVASGVTYNFSLYMRRTNTGLTGRLLVKGGFVTGITNDTYTDMTVAADTWEQVTVTVTPTEDGVVEVWAQCWGGTTYSLYVDDFLVS